VLIAYALFFLAGLVFGAVLASNWAFAAVAMPLILGVLSAISNGIDAYLLLTLLLALVVTVAGILAGRVLAARMEANQPATDA
jgi:hypothetical protein